MTVINTLLDQAKKQLKLRSDAQLATHLKLNRSAICQMRQNGGLSSETAVKLGKIIGMNPGAVKLAVEADQSKSPTFKKSVKEILEELADAGHCILC